MLGNIIIAHRINSRCMQIGSHSTACYKMLMMNVIQHIRQHAHNDVEIIQQT